MTAHRADDPETIEVRAEERIDTARLEPYLREHLDGAEGPLDDPPVRRRPREPDVPGPVRRTRVGAAPPAARTGRAGRARHAARAPRALGAVPPATRSRRAAICCAPIHDDHRRRLLRDGTPPRHRLPADDPRAVARPARHPARDRRDADRRPRRAARGRTGERRARRARPARRLRRRANCYGWIERWHNALTPDVGPAEPFVGWLRQTVPQQRRTTLVHNDYKLDNTLRDAADPRRTVAVLDWDMCTRGEPMMDLGYLLGALGARRATRRAAAHGRMPTWNDGFSDPPRSRRALRARERRRHLRPALVPRVQRLPLRGDPAADLHPLRARPNARRALPRLRAAPSTSSPSAAST